MKLKETFYYLSFGMILMGLSSCYPIGDDPTYEDIDIALTVYDKDYYSPQGNNGFQNFNTFIVPDTVVHIIEQGVTDNISRAYDEYVIQQVRSNLLKFGYIEEENPEVNAPEIAVTISITTSDHVVYTWYPYWGWYWMLLKKGDEASASPSSYSYAWDPYYGYGSTYTYTTGTLILEMVEVARIDGSEEELPVIWAGIVNGLAGGPAEGIKSRLSVGIDRCFNQSLYLFKN